MVSVLNLMTAIALLLFGVGYLLYGIGPFAGMTITLLGTFWAVFLSTPWTLSLYSVHLNEVGSRASGGFMGNSWILGLIGTMLAFLGCLIMLFGVGAMLGGGAGIAAIIGLILVALGPLLAIMLPGLAKIMARDEIGMPTLGLVAEIFGIIFSVMLLLSVILSFVSFIVSSWMMLITGIVGLAFGILEAISLFMYEAPKARR